MNGARCTIDRICGGKLRGAMLPLGVLLAFLLLGCGKQDRFTFVFVDDAQTPLEGIELLYEQAGSGGRTVSVGRSGSDGKVTLCGDDLIFNTQYGIRTDKACDLTRWRFDRNRCAVVSFASCSEVMFRARDLLVRRNDLRSMRAEDGEPSRIVVLSFESSVRSELLPQLRWLDLKTTPGAEVEVNGERLGAVSTNGHLFREFCPGDSHRCFDSWVSVVVRAPGYETLDRSLPLPDPGGTLTLSEDLYRRESGGQPIREEESREEPTATTGRLIVRSSPSGAAIELRREGASVYTAMGATPWVSGELDAGRWEIRLEKDGYMSGEYTVSTLVAETRDLTFDLEMLPPQLGIVRMVVSPYGDVYLDGEKLVSEGKGVRLEVESGTPHTIEIVHPPSYGRMEIPDVIVSPGDTLDLGRQQFRYGKLTVASNMAANLAIDGQWLDAQTPHGLERISVGEHTLSIRREGLEVRRVELMGDQGQSRHELSPISSGTDAPVYGVVVEEGQEVIVRFELVHSR